jgi:hypothetical protein
MMSDLECPGCGLTTVNFDAPEHPYCTPLCKRRHEEKKAIWKLRRQLFYWQVRARWEALIEWFRR